MATEVFSIDTYAAGANLYIRIYGKTGSDLGKVLDFADNTFKTLGAATTPYAVMTEQADWDGTGYSGYTVSVDLANVNSTATLKRYVIKAFNNVTPVATDIAISNGLPITVRSSALVESGDADVIADSILDRTDGVESGVTPRQSLRLVNSVVGSKLSGAGTGTEVFRDVNDTKNRVTATVDASGNRTNIVLSLD